MKFFISISFHAEISRNSTNAAIIVFNSISFWFEMFWRYALNLAFVIRYVFLGLLCTPPDSSIERKSLICRVIVLTTGWARYNSCSISREVRGL